MNKNKGLNITLWIAQILLAGIFGMAGWSHAAQPISDLVKMYPWIANAPEALVRFIGFSELAGALGLLLPALTRIKPILTPWAGIGLAVIMVLASAFHFSRGEMFMVPFTLLFAAIASFVAWGRFRKVPISDRSQVA